MPKGFIILPNQLFKSLPARKTVQVVLVEALGLFLDYRFHKKKLIFHRASLKYYQSFLEQKKYKVHYLDYQTLSKPTGLGGWLKKKKINQVSLYDPVDKNLETQLKKEFDRAKIVYEFLSCPLFLCQEPDLKNFFSDKEHYSMNSFYISQRKRLEILLDSGKPRGGKWSFDKENRQKLGKDVKVPGIHPPASNKFVREAKEYVSSCFPDNPGSTENFFYPVTHKDAEKWLEDFIEKRLDGFGPYEDAISVDQSFLFHSLLSPLLNSGLLTPQEVLKGIIDYSQQNDIRFNSLEGFVRQVVGWREFLRAVYTLQGQKQKESNFWGFKHKLPPQFYDATTGIDPVDHIIKRVLTNA
ncbi:MAG: cryptochrome/photolyase family protein [Planctomycetota bacterium]|jgi:deoxyribodipyrimidine photolyase-related protein